MSQLFHPSINVIAKVSILVVIIMLAGLGGLGYYAVRSPYLTEVGIAKAQPVPFSHKQHVGDLGLDCRYCHSTVEETNTASIPSTDICMGCHAQVAPEAPTLAPIRLSFETDQPLEWIRIHNLADYVYFNHAIHITQGIGCESCHGRIDQMSVVAKAHTLQMDWCLECHRSPEQYIRPRQAVFTMGWEAPTDQTGLGSQLVAAYDVRVDQLTDCSICHR